MTNRPPLTPAKIEKIAARLIRLWKAEGLKVGKLVVNEKGVELSTPEAAQKELDPFEQWERDNAA